jgi:hypothetical protein
LRDSIQEARARSKSIDIKGKSQILHLILDRVAQRKGYCLNLRKKGTFKQNPLSRI